MPKEIKEIKDFLEIASRSDARGSLHAYCNL
jgi:hypothetical protein